MSVFPEEIKKADIISRKEENLQRYRNQLIEQSILLQTSNINDRLMKRKTRTLTQSFIKNSFAREVSKDSHEEDSFSTTSSIINSQLLQSELIGDFVKDEENKKNN